MIIVDMSHLFYRNIFASQRAVQENPDLCAHLLLNSLYAMVDRFKVTQTNPIVAAFDCKKKNSWRYDYYNNYSQEFNDYKGMTYKGQRKLALDMPWDEIWTVIADVKSYLQDSTDVQVVEHEKAEADDVIYAAYFAAVSACDAVTIISSDKDFIQLLGPPDVKIFDPLKRAFREFDAKQSSRYLLEQILQGDTSDNILPIKRGVGKKTAAKWANDIEAYLHGHPELQKRFGFNRVLIDLTEVPEWIFMDISDSLKVTQFNWSLTETVRFYKKYKLRKLSERIDTLHLKDDSGLSKFM